MKFEAIAFDMGNVLLPIDFKPCKAFIEKQISYSINEWFDRIREEYIDYEKGTMRPDDFYRVVIEKTGIYLSKDDWEELWGNIFKEDPAMLHILEQVKRHYSIYMISNTCESHFTYIQHHFPAIMQFDGYILSFKEGFRKPDPSIYQILQIRYHHDLTKTIFIDDLEENILGAQNLGIHGILHKNAEDTKQQLAQLGVLEYA